MLDIFDQFATDPKLELEGVWTAIGSASKKLDNGDADPASAPQILVARSGNRRHSRIVSQLYEANKSLLELKNDAADDRGEEITIQSMAQSILLGWKNLGFRGEAVPDGWNITDAKRLLAVKDFRDMVSKHANDFHKYQLAKEAEAVKN